MLGVFRRVLILVKTSFRPAGATVTGAGGPVSSGTFKRNILRALQRAFSAKDTFTVIVTLQRHVAFVCQGPVETNFLTNGRFIFPNRPSDGGFGRPIGNAGKNDMSFL